MVDRENIIFSFKKSYTISYNKDYFSCVGGSVNLYDVKTGAFIVNFKDMKQPNYSRFTSDNRLIVKTTTGFYYVYDMVLKELIYKLRPPKNVIGAITNFAVTPDNRFIIDLAEIPPFCQLMVMEIETGKYRLYDLGNAKTGKILSNESESKYYIAVTKSGEKGDGSVTHYAEFYSFTYPFKTLELEKMSIRNKDFSGIDYNSGKIVIAGYTGEIVICDLKNGVEDQLNYDKGGVLYDLSLSKNGKYIVLVESDNLYIFDLETKKCIKTFSVDYGCFADFFDNDTKLLIGTWKKGYCIDIEPILSSESEVC